jgi:hypothetical protein
LKLQKIPQPLDFTLRKDADPGIAEVEDAKKRLARIEIIFSKIRLKFENLG